MEDFCARDLPEGLKKEAQYKLLHSDLKLILDSVEYVPDDRALQIMAEVRDFVKDHIDDDVMETASIQDMQRYDCANRGDLEGLRKLLVYTREAYDKAPITERDGKLYAELPEDIFKVKKRDLKDEFSRMRRKVWVDDISIADGGFNIDAHIYIPRYNMKDPEDQSIEITLVNEETGHTVNVDARPKETKHITKLRGTVKDPVSADKGPDVELLRFQHIQALREALLDPDGGGRPQSEIGHIAVYKKHIPRFAGADRRLALVAYVPVIAGVPQREPLQDQGDQNDNDKEGQHLYGMRIRPPSARGSRLTFPQRALRLSRCRSPSCNTGGAPAHKGQGV